MMGIRTNLSALNAQNQGTRIQQQLKKNLQRLSSGLRINQASDDAAGLAVSERILSQTRGLQQASQNVQDGVSLIQTAEAGISQIQDSVQRIRQLSLQAANGTLTDQDRGSIQKEIDQLTQEIDRQTQTVEFNGKPLLDGTADVTLQVGANQGETINANISATDTTSLGLNGIDVTTQAAAQNAIQSSTQALDTLSSQRADLGAVQNRLEQASNFIGTATENQLAATSRIRDADIATESMNLVRNQLLSQSNLSSLMQSNLQSQNVLKLLGG